MNFVSVFLSRIMDWCYTFSGNYGWAIVLFTFITKIILLPLSLWTYFNGITMIKIQPDINFIKVKYWGQPDLIAEEQAKLFKEKKYSPLASVIPTVVQMLLLIVVVGVIRLGIENPAIDMQFGPINLGDVPAEKGLSLIWSPIIAGIAAFILCIAQNKSNVLQAEQSNLNKYGTTILSVVLSLYLGWFVPVGTAWYWVLSNLFAVLQLYICNWIFKPRQYVDYERLEESRRQLAELEGVGKKKKEGYFSENKRRERSDYKRFFSVVNKHLVFYSESNGFYKYYKGMIEYLLDNTNLTIHYITSDPNDQIFEMEKTNPKIRGYFIGENKLITLMMKMDADVVCMTMPDIDNYHIKRSYVRKDIEYIYIPHGMDSYNLGTRPGSVANYDTVFCTGPHQVEEYEQMEEVYGTRRKNLFKWGYCLLDDMVKKYSEMEHKNDESKKMVLIAPSWQPDNIIDLCLEGLLDSLKKGDYQIIVRPHPQQVKHKPEYFTTLKEKYKDENIEIQTDFSSDNPVLEADVLITDWSGITWEYTFTTLRPTLYINTPMKIMNPDYKKIASIPVNISLRNEMGYCLEVDQVNKAKDAVDMLIENKDKYEGHLKELRDKFIFNLGTSSQVGAEYMINQIQNKIKEKKNEKDN